MELITLISSRRGIARVPERPVRAAQIRPKDPQSRTAARISHGLRVHAPHGKIDSGTGVEEQADDTAGMFTRLQSKRLLGRRRVLPPSRRRSLGHGRRQAQVQEAEIAEQHPTDGQDSVTLDADQLEIERHGQQSDRHRKDRADDVVRAVSVGAQRRFSIWCAPDYRRGSIFAIPAVDQPRLKRRLAVRSGEPLERGV